MGALGCKKLRPVVPGVGSQDARKLEPGLESWQEARQLWGRGFSPPSSPPSSWGLRACLSALFISVPLSFCPRGLSWPLLSIFPWPRCFCFPVICLVCYVPLPWNPLLFCFCSYLTFLLAFLSSNSLEADVTGLPHLSLQATSEPCVLASTVVPGERQPCLVQRDSPALCPQSRCAEGGCHVSRRPAQRVPGADWLQSVIFYNVLEQDIHCGIFFPLIVLVLLLYYNTGSRVWFCIVLTALKITFKNTVLIVRRIWFLPSGVSPCINVISQK